MKPIWKAWLCQIDITNVCPGDCLYCDRYIRHVRKDQMFFMSVAELIKALDSLDGWPGLIGIIGGEPTVHPQFVEICDLLQSRGLRNKLHLYTMGGPAYERYQTLIDETFLSKHINCHTAHQVDVCLHQPTTIAIQDAVGDEKYRRKLIDDCWVQRLWCPTIAPKGAFFCEIAYSLDSILDGPGGYPVKPGWWKKTPAEFQDQVDRYCRHCGMAIPLKRECLKTRHEKFSSGNLALFRTHNLPRLSGSDVILFDRKPTVEEMEETKLTWDPGNYRQDIMIDKMMEELRKDGRKK